MGAVLGINFLPYKILYKLREGQKIYSGSYNSAETCYSLYFVYIKSKFLGNGLYIKLQGVFMYFDPIIVPNLNKILETVFRENNIISNTFFGGVLTLK